MLRMCIAVKESEVKALFRLVSPNSISADAGSSSYQHILPLAMLYSFIKDITESLLIGATGFDFA